MNVPARNTPPLPPIQPQSRSVEDTSTKTSNQLAEKKNSNLDQMEESVATIRQCIERLEKDLKFKKEESQADCHEIANAGRVWIFNSETAKPFCRKIVDLQFVELYKKLWKTHFNKTLFTDNGRIARELMPRFQAVIWNMSDKSNEARHRIIQAEVHKDLLGYLKNDLLSPNSIKKDGTRAKIVEGMLAILRNTIQRLPDACEDYRCYGAVAIMQSHRQTDNINNSTYALMIQSYLVTEEENEKLNSNQETFRFLVNILKDSISVHGTPKSQYTWSVIELIISINKLAANDGNKNRILDAGALPYYVKCLREEFGAKVQKAAADGIWILSFKCRESIMQEPGCIEGLKRLLQHNEKDVKEKAEGALWILEEKGKLSQDNGTLLGLTARSRNDGNRGVTLGDDCKKESSEKFKTSDSTQNGVVSRPLEDHVFISYQWDAKPTVHIVSRKLKDAGFKVWIDEDNMSGSVLEAMALAVENASVVVVCLSQRYKDSPNCRTEAEYTFRLHKRIVPLRLQPKYYPDGWLGAMVGSKLVFDVSIENKVEDSLRQLVKELRATQSDNDVNSVAVQQSSSSSSNQSASSTATTSTLSTSAKPASVAVKLWAENDVDDWITRNNIKHLKSWFSGMNGPLLLEYAELSSAAPEAMLTYYSKNHLKLLDILSINKALKNLN